MSKLIYNAIRTPDGTILESTNRHDYRSYQDKNGFTYMVDGGTDYARRSVAPVPYEELSVYSDAPHETVRDVMSWGTRGVKGDQPLRQVKLKDMDTSHIQACLDTQPQMSPAYRSAFETELQYRKGDEK